MPIRTVIEPLSIIVGVDESGGFGKDGKIPWIDQSFSKKDLKHFQKITKNGICIMGRKTYDDMLEMMLKRKKKEDIEDILPNRQSFVVTSSGGETPGAQKVFGLRDAIYELDASDRREVFILGGLRMFFSAMPFVNKIYLTIVPGIYECDVYFPLNSLDNFKITSGKKSGDLKFLTYQRMR